MKRMNIEKRLLILFVTVLVGCSVVFSGWFKNNSMPEKFNFNAPPQETITAELSGEKRDLPVYGFNGNNVRGPSWTNEKYRDSIAALKMQIIRYPGGSVGEWWDWKRGWFIDSATANKYNVHVPQNFQKITPIANGLKELKLVVDEAHCNVLFTLNMITSTLEDQVEMLKQAEAIGIPVKFVELGNELNLPASMGRKKFKLARDYGQTSDQWIKTIKSNFPGAKISIVGGNQKYDTDVKNWNNETISQTIDADAIVAHLYPLPHKILDDSGINFKNLYNDFKQKFDDQGFNSITNKPIWITEYNIHWAFGVNKMSKEEKDLLQKSSSGWGQSLATLLMTSEATSLSPNVQMVINHNLSSFPIWAAIETQNETFRQLPNGIGMSVWLKACNGMKTIQKLSFLSNGGKALPDFQVFGWTFSNDELKTFLFVNLTDHVFTTSANALKIPSTANCNIYFADKNMVVNNKSEIGLKQFNFKNTSFEMPPYSVAVISER
jgi:hypothetical protein